MNTSYHNILEPSEPEYFPGGEVISPASGGSLWYIVLIVAFFVLAEKTFK